MATSKTLSPETVMTSASLLTSIAAQPTANIISGTTESETLLGTASADWVSGDDGDDTLIDAGGRTQTGNDALRGGAGEDMIYSQWGRDWLSGGRNHDHLISRSDAGEPEIAQDPAAEKYYDAENLTRTQDTLRGGAGNDQFLFRIDLNATAEIIAKHTDDAGDIDWEGVTGENGAPHLHWVESIGDDRIMDYSEAQGDQIVIEGHTAAFVIRHRDLNGDGIGESIIHLYSDQGGAGAHNGDQLGSITVYGDRVEANDICLDNMAHHGAFGNISEMPLV